jgi:hypothetical protein
MAKGNDGNLLQHAIECEIVRTLVTAQGHDELDLIVTHGMSPFEPVSDTGQPNTRLFGDWLDVAVARKRAHRLPQESAFPAVVVAYRRCLATYLHYPNTGELVASLVGRNRIYGEICEFDETIATDLRQAWQNTHVNVCHGDWRHQISAISERVTARAWLMTMDPMTFDPNGGLANFGPADFGLIEACLREKLDSQHPGCFCLFCYSMTQDRENEFRASAQDFATKLGQTALFATVQARHGRDRQVQTHAGVLISNCGRVTDRVAQVWDEMLNGPPN